MKALILGIYAFFSTPISAAPDWVEGLRSGEERVRTKNGSSTLYRRLADTCEKATRLVEEDIIREFNNLVVHKMEHIFQDMEKGYCAVVASVNEHINVEKEPLHGKGLMLQKANKAKQNAYFGMSLEDFRKVTKDNSPILIANKEGMCFKHFKSLHVSVHGARIGICWANNIILGYCDPTSDVCETKFP